MAITNATAPYPVTVGNMYFGDLGTGGGITKVEYARNVGISFLQSIQKVPGSGKITDVVSKITGIDLTLASSRLPKSIVRKYRGQTVSTNKGFSAVNTDDKFVQFAFGFVVKNSDGTNVFNWLPNVTMTENNSSYATTPVDGSNDPVQDTVINALPDPTSGDIIIDYDQGEVVEGKVALTEEAFFAQVIKSMTDSIIDSETDVTPGT